MNYEKETLQHLRRSLNEEDDETSVIRILESHHKYLKEYCDILLHSDEEPKSRQSTLELLMQIFTMHAKAEEETLYKVLKESRAHEARLEGLKGQEEHAIAYEIMAELKDMKVSILWSEEIDAKAKMLAGLIRSHIREEENVMYPVAESFIAESKLIDLTDDYLDKCKANLDDKREDIPSEVSMSDVMTFFY